MAAALERGQPIPESILNKPEVWGICRPMWNCFWTLAGSRALVSTGMGAIHGRLSYESISRWAHDHGYADDIEELDEFVTLVQRLDGRWLELNAPKTK